MKTTPLNSAFNLPEVQFKGNEVVVIEPTDDKTLESDFDIAAKNLKELMKVGETAVGDLYEIASSAEVPKDYDSLANLLKVVSDMSTQLVGLHEKKTKAKASPNAPAPVTNTAIFVGTTEDLIRQSKENKE